MFVDTIEPIRAIWFYVVFSVIVIVAFVMTCRAIIDRYKDHKQNKKRRK